MNQNYKQNNFILFFLVEVQYIKKTKQKKTKKKNKINIQNKKVSYTCHKISGGSDVFSYPMVIPLFFSFLLAPKKKLEGNYLC